MNSIDLLSQISTSYATVSLDNQSETLGLEAKLHAISEAGFQQIELGFPDIVNYASAAQGRKIQADEYAVLAESAHHIKSLAARNNLKILMLQPFSNFEGWPKGSPERMSVFKKAQGWIEIMHAVGTDMLQVGSTDTPSPPLSSNTADLATDLAELADMLASHGFRLCYENWCWATHGRTWKQVWNIVQQANRPNIGLCLDTFQEAGAQWADPTTQSGLIEGYSEQQLTQSYMSSLHEMARTIPAEKVYVLQISDGYKPEPRIPNQLGPGCTSPRAQWCSAWRPMPFDGGYLPIVPMTSVLLQAGFRSVFSMEIFDGGPDGKGKNKDAKKYCAQAMSSLRRLIAEPSEKPHRP